MVGNPPTVGIVGFGFAGLATLAHVVRRGGTQRVVVVAADDRGLGAAYSTTDPAHLLNVRAERMGARAGAVGGFVDWLCTRAGAAACRDLGVPVPGPKDFAPRVVYGRYLADLREATLAEAAATGITVDIVGAEATALHRDGDGWVIEAGRRRVRVGSCVLALGHEPRAAAESLAGAAPGDRGSRAAAALRHGGIAAAAAATAQGGDAATARGGATVEGRGPARVQGRGAATEKGRGAIGGPRRSAGDGRFVARAGGDGSALIVGTGLSAIDAVLSLRGDGFGGEIVLVSRHGLLPRPHCPRSRPYELPAARLDALRCAADVRDLVADTIDAGRDWRLALEGLRPHTQRVWRQFSPAAQREVAERWGAVWSAHRHRMAPSVAARIAAERDAGTLRVVAGRVGDSVSRPDPPANGTGCADLDHPDRRADQRVDGHADAPSGSVVVARADGATETLRPSVVVDCTGATLDWTRSGRPLVRQLVADGHVVAHHTGLGVCADDEHRVGPDLFAVGSALTGELWESVAVPELREQAATVAAALAAEPVAAAVAVA